MTACLPCSLKSKKFSRNGAAKIKIIDSSGAPSAPIPRDLRLAKVAHALLDDVADERTLDEWGHYAGMARRTFMRAFSAEVGMPFGRWRQQARLFAAIEMLAEGKSVTETAVAVGYNSVSAFIEMFRTMLGSTPQTYFRSKRERVLK